jgi:glucosamine-6-phosphate deaminase
MHIRIFTARGNLARTLATDIASAISDKPDLVLGLPTGRTPMPLYGELVSLYRSGRIDFSQVTTFNVDEFLGVAPDGPGSYRAAMRDQLFDHVNLRARRIHFLNGAAGNLARECARYERAIARANGIDLQILGLGANGHIGFNEPARALAARTHRTRLAASTRRANRALFGGRVGQVPREGLTMGVGTIVLAKRIVLVATGREKATAVARLIQPRIAADFPASILHLHRYVSVWLDREAASEVGQRSSVVASVLACS